MIIPDIPAEIGQWYLQTGSGERFCVVGLDDQAHTIEVQSYEGDLGEFDAETWRSLRLTRCPDPEGGSDPMDELEAFDRSALTGGSWSHQGQLGSGLV